MLYNRTYCLQKKKLQPQYVKANVFFFFFVSQLTAINWKLLMFSLETSFLVFFFLLHSLWAFSCLLWPFSEFVRIISFYKMIYHVKLSTEREEYKKWKLVRFSDKTVFVFSKDVKDVFTHFFFKYIFWEDII